MNTLVTIPKNGSEVSTKKHLTTLPSLSSWVDNFFDNELSSGFLANFNKGITLPAVNIMETAEAYALEIAVPGMKKSDFTIDIDNKVLSISSSKKDTHEESNANYTRREFGYSSFKRTFTLPDTVEEENVSATYEDGILKVYLPKREEAKQKPPKRIDIS
jgi:HSP20 family protein